MVSLKSVNSISKTSFEVSCISVVILTADTLSFGLKESTGLFGGDGVFGTGNWVICEIGLTVDDKAGYFVVCLELIVMYFVRLK